MRLLAMKFANHSKLCCHEVPYWVGVSAPIKKNPPPPKNLPADTIPPPSPSARTPPPPLLEFSIKKRTPPPPFWRLEFPLPLPQAK